MGARKASPKPPKKNPVRGGDDGAETQKAYSAAEKRARADAKKYPMYGTNARMVEQQSKPTPLPPCKTEDSANCHWDAKRQGDGRGKSFDNRGGKITYTGKKKK